MTNRKPKDMALSLVFDFINATASEAEGKLSRWAEAWGRLLRKSKTDPPFIKALGRITPVLGLNATRQVLICLVDSWVCWGPSKTENQRDAYRTARKLNDEISKDAAALAWDAQPVGSAEVTGS